MSPGFEEGQEACVHRELTEYAAELGVPCFALQIWEGKGQDSHITNYTLIDKNTKKIIFTDRRVQVCEYILESIAEQLQSQKEEAMP
jgi:hypothetical protein